MSSTTILLVTLVAYKALLVAIGIWASKRTSDETDFFLGGRKLGPVVAAISYASSASSAWTLLGLSGAAYVLGISVVWVAGGSITGMLVAWFWIGPRLMHFSRRHDHLTLTDFLAHGATGKVRRAIVGTASLIVVLSFVFYVAAQFQGAGNTFSSAFDLPMAQSILIGAAVILVYTLLGGFWAVSVTDTVQGLLMALTAVVLPLVALVLVGGPAGFIEGLRAASSPGQLSWTAGSAGLVAAGIVLGSLGIGFGTYGQPHLLVRFMALRDERALRQARWITVAWYAAVFAGMCFLGLVGHILKPAIANPETVLLVLTEELFNPVLAAVLLAAILSAIMSTADSQLLVAASAIAHDLGVSGQRVERKLMISRLTVVVLVILAVWVALYLPERIFSRVLFAWSALGAAFGPTVFFRLAAVSVRPVGVWLSIVTGFALSVVFYSLPNAPGDVLERLAPFACATAVLFFSRARATQASA